MVKRHLPLVVCAYFVASAAAFAQSSYVFQLPGQTGIRPQIVGLGDSDFPRFVSSSSAPSGASQVLSTPSGTRFYILAPGGLFSVNPPDGKSSHTLTPITHIDAVAGAASAAEITPDGKYALVIANGHFYVLDASVHIFGASDSQPTPADTGVPTGATPISVVASHDAKTAWILSNTNTGSSTITALDLATFQPAASPLNLQSAALSMVLSPRNLLYVTTNTTLYEIDPVSFTVTTFGTIKVPGPTGPLQFTPDGNTAYYLNSTVCDKCAPLSKLNVVSHSITDLTPPTDGNAPPPVDQVLLAANDRVFALSPAPRDDCSFCRKIWDVNLTSFTLTPSTLSSSPAFLPTSDVVAAAVSNERPSARYLYLLASDHNFYRVKLSTNGIDDHSSLDPVNGSTLSFVSIPAQSGASTLLQINPTQNVGSGGATTFIAQVLDKDGRPVFGANAAFSADAASGVTISTPSPVTTAGGWAQTVVTAPATAGTYPVTLKVGSLSTTFQLVVGGTIDNGNTSHMSIYTGDGQLLRQSESTTETHQPLTVKVTDATGNPVANVLVTFAVTEGLGTVDPLRSSSLTDTNGLAATDFTSGNIGHSEIHYQLSKVTASSDKYGSVEFYEVTHDAPINANHNQSDILTPLNKVLTIAQGELRPGAISVRTYLGATGAPIPNVGLRLADAINNPNLINPSPVISCQGLSRSDNNGISRCDVLAACQLGVTLPRNFTAVVVVGEFQIALQVVVTNGPPSQLKAISGNNSSGHPGDSFTLLAQATQACGQPAIVSGFNWTVLQGTAVISPQSVSDSGGNVAARVTLGQTPGPVRIQVSAPGLPAVIFNLTNQAVIKDISLVSGGGQTVVVGQPFVPLVFLVRDANNNPIPGLPVNFSISGVATFNPASATTNAQGQVQTTVTAGTTPGPIVLTASVVGASTTATLSSRLPGPQISTASFTNAASGAPGLTPCGLVTVLGPGIAPDLQGVVTGFGVASLPLTLAGVSIDVQQGTNVMHAPMEVVANQNGVQQANFQAPCELTAGAATVVVNVNGSSTSVPGVPVSSVQPGIFTFTLPGHNKVYGAVIRANGYVTPDNPAHLGEKLYMVVTGLGQTTPAAVTNVNGTGQGTALPVVVGVADRDTQVNYARYLAGAVGEYLIEFQIPLDTPTGPDKALAVAVRTDAATNALVFGNPVFVPAVAAP